MRGIILLRTPIFLALLLGCSACAPKDNPITRATSPDRALDAITAERDTDATVGQVLTVYIVGRGENVSGKPVFLADKVIDLQIHWQDAAHLVIHAAKARISQSHSPEDVDLGGKRRRIWIRFDVDDMISD